MRTVYLPLAECYCQIENILKPYVGIVAEIADHKPVLEYILDVYFHGYSLNNYNAYEHFTQFSLPTELTNQILQRITSEVVQMIQYSFSVIYPARNYSYRFLETDLVIQESITIMQFPMTAQPQDDTQADDDGYTPERLRLKH